jgi:periplasmic protein TonB
MTRSTFMTLEPPRELVIQGTGASGTPFIAALAGAGWLHLLLILAVSFVWPEPGPPPESAMEVILLKDVGATVPNRSPRPRWPSAIRWANHRSATPRSQPSATHSRNRPIRARDGWVRPAKPWAKSLHPEQTTASIPSEVPPHDDPLARPDAMTLPLREPPTAPVLATEAEAPPRPDVDPFAPRQTVVDAAQILASQGLEVARLTSSQ